MTPEQLTSAFVDAARKELAEALAKIRHCLAQLTDDDVWWRPNDKMNAIGNLVLHLCGNMRQWIISGVGGAADVRDRPAEFAQRQLIPSAELLKRLVDTVAEADQVIGRVDPANLVHVRKVQYGEPTGAGAIFHSVSHFVGHTQEIIYVTRLRTGEAYKFMD
jgi:hypothetical protein